MRSLFIALNLTFWFSIANGQVNQIEVKSEPAWISTFSYSENVPDTSNTSGGYYYLLLDRQFNFPKKQFYRHFATKILTEKGLPFVSSINESYNPAFQKIFFHKVIIWRNGIRIDKLQKSKFEIVRREENAERYVYDKSLSAILNIEDVRVGDIIEYSFTIEGSNPVFGNHYFNTLYFNYSDPIGKIAYRIIINKDSDIQFKYFNQKHSPKESFDGSSKIYVWETENIPALFTEDGTPSWFNPNDRVEFTDFKSWNEVREWAKEIFQVKQKDNKELSDKIEEIRIANKSEDEKILACIRFVQEKIRYLSFSDGIHSHKPHAPNQIVSQKFGDCKDKSLLLSHMLNQLGLKSSPALVTTDFGQSLPESLPDPWDFNHCIVQMVYKDSVYWIDPTLNPQFGKLKKLYFPNYKNALVINDQKDELTSIPYGIKESMIDVQEEYLVDQLGSSVTLKVKTDYYGDEADEMRSYKASNSKDEINQNFLNFYGNDFSEIERAKDVEFVDNKETNVITTTEEYTIKEFWNYDSALNQNSASIYARIISNYLYKPNTKIRKMPLRMTYPREVYQAIKIQFPENWNAQEATKNIESKGFSYHSSSRHWDNIVSLRYAYKSKTEFLEAKDVKDHVEKINKVYDDLSFNISYAPNNGKTSNFNYPYFIITVIAGLLVFYASRKIYLYDPLPLSEETYDQIGGWLVLLCIGICLSPFISAYSLLTNEYFSYIQWRILTDSGYTAYNPLLGAFVLLEFISTIVSLGFSLLLIILFFQRRSSVPRLLSIYFAFNLLILIIDYIGGMQFNLYSEKELSSNITEIIKSFVKAGIWIPYLFFSDRAKGTFTERIVG